MNSDSQRRAVLNEYGDVQSKMQAWAPPANPHQARYSQLHAEILSWGDSVDAEQPYGLETKRYALDMSARGNRRDMGPSAQKMAFEAFRELPDPKLVKGQWTVGKFNPFTVFSTTIAAVTKHLGEPFLDRIAPKERTGPRSFTVTAKLAAQKAA